MRWLIIVRSGRADLYEQLRARYVGHADVILDRRVGNRRRRRGPAPKVSDDGLAKRRFRDRRLPLSLPEQDMWRHHGYRLVYRSGLFAILHASPESASVG